jgi:hypothetical protein
VAIDRRAHRHLDALGVSEEDVMEAAGFETGRSSVRS